MWVRLPSTAGLLKFLLALSDLVRQRHFFCSTTVKLPVNEWKRKCEALNKLVGFYLGTL